MTPHLAQIVRHPVKSIGFEELAEVTLSAGQPMPWDRVWAVTTQGAQTDGAPEGWLPKRNFVRGAAEGGLQAIRARFDAGTGALHLTHPHQRPFAGTVPQDSAALFEWLRPLWPATRPDPVALVSRADGGALTDVPDPWLAVLNHASLRALGQRMARDLSIHRFRGNLWLDGLAPWEEFDLQGREITVGPVRLRIEERITRCVATSFDPETGLPAGDTLEALESGWGHRDFGVYARVMTGGTLRCGDTVEVRP